MNSRWYGWFFGWLGGATSVVFGVVLISVDPWGMSGWNFWIALFSLISGVLGLVGRMVDIERRLRELEVGQRLLVRDATSRAPGDQPPPSA